MIDSHSRASIDETYGVDRILQCREDHDSRGVRSKTPTSAQPCYVNIDRQTEPAIDQKRETAIDRQRDTAIDRRRETATDRQTPSPIDR